MSFFFETIAIPFWFIAFILGCAVPLWLKWYKKFHKKFKISGNLKKKFQRKKSAEDLKEDVLKKATEHLKSNGNSSGTSNHSSKKRKAPKKESDQIKKQNIRDILKIVANSGETGVLPKSISDIAGINTLDTANALTYLIEKDYVEMINSTSGPKYYLTDLGRRYCINKQYI